MIKKFITLASFSFVIAWPLQACDTLETQDNFDFLSKKFPSLLEQSKKPFQQCYEEEKHYEKLKKSAQNNNQSYEEILTKGAKDLLRKNILHWFGVEHESFVLNQLKPMIATLEERHPKHGYYNTFFQRALQNHTLYEDIFLSAGYLFQVVQDQGGGTVLFLGRSPCLIQVAYEEILKVEKDSAQIPVHVNFSGHPDALTKRESDFFSSPTNIIRDIVTPEKLDHYFKYLDTKNLLRTKKLFIVDLIGSGSSLNSFLRLINVYYKNRHLEIPPLSFLNLTADMNWSIDRPTLYTFKKTGNLNNQGILHLPEDKNRNMKPFQIPTWGIPIFDKVLREILDQDMFQEFLVHGIQYPAQKWTSDFDSQRDKGGEYHTNFYAHLKKTFGMLIQTHKKLFTPSKQ